MVVWMAFCTIVVNSNGNRYVPYLNQNGKRFDLNWNWINNRFNQNGRVSSPSRNWLYFSPDNMGEFSFKCFCKPPNILPTSKSGSERRA